MLDILFVPSNTSHLGKNRILLDTLQEHGCRVRMLCLDEVLEARFWTRPQLEASGFPFDVLPGNGFRADRHWVFQGFQKGRVFRSMRCYLEQRRPDAIIIGTEYGVGGRAPGAVGRRMGIPIILIVDGLMCHANPNFRPSIARRVYAWVWITLQRLLGVGRQRFRSEADLLLVMNDLSRRVLMSQGLAADRIRVVGSPEFDELAQQVRAPEARGKAQAVREKLGMAASRPVILFAHQALDDHQLVRDSIDTMIKAARPCGATVLVKLHPRGGQTLAQWADWAARNGCTESDVRFIMGECTSLEAVQICDVCVTYFSTVAIEAMVCGKPTLFMLFHRSRERLTARDVGDAGLDARDLGELQRNIVEVLTNESLRRQLQERGKSMFEREMFGLDGRSAERSESAIRELTGSKGRHANRAGAVPVPSRQERTPAS